MVDFLLTILFCWLFFKALGLAFRLTWGTAKVIVSVLLAIAVPLLVVCLIFIGGIALLLPIALIAAAFGILKKCFD